MPAPDTIFAVSSGAPPAAIAVLRISGQVAVRTATELAGTLPPVRMAGLRAIRDPIDGLVLDRALVLVFPGPATATGEDLVELHLHGGRAVVAAVETVLEARPGLRRAEPGEFTRRALVAGRIDLTEAEGLGDLLAAETEGQRRAAMLVAEGGIRRKVEDWSVRVLALSARIEAELDFSDEDDVVPAQIEAVQRSIGELATEMSEIIDAPPVERLHEGIRVVLAGPPNSGKSTLLNRLVDRDAAIVSPIAGTTRDRIEVPIRRDGIAYLFVDTAGIRDDGEDEIERIGIARAQDAIDMADIVVWLGDDAGPTGALMVHARADLSDRSVMPTDRLLALSATTGQGIADLWSALKDEAQRLLPRLNAIALNRRQRMLAGAAVDELRDATTVSDPLLIAEGLRRALLSLHAITGHSDTEAMLDALFGKFCIGK